MSSKAFSTRLNTEIPQQNEIAELLDLLDSDESGLLNSSDWLLQAALMRQEHDQQAEDQIALLYDSAISAEKMESEQLNSDFPTSLEPIIMWNNEPIEIALQSQFDSLSKEEQAKWLKEAALMRFSIEQNVPGYFISQWQPVERLNQRLNQSTFKEHSEDAIEETYKETSVTPDSISDARNVEVETQSQQKEVEALEPVVEPPRPDDGFNIYRDALPEILKLEVLNYV